jgi:hypothetical protein
LRLTFLIEYHLRTLIAVFSRVSGTRLEEIVVGFDILSKVDSFTRCKLSGGFKDNSFAVVIGALEVTGKPNLVDILAAFGSVRGRDFILGVDCRKRAFGNARAAINAGVRVNVHHRPFCHGLARDNALHGANFNAASVTNAQTGDNVSHWGLLLVKTYNPTRSKKLISLRAAVHAQKIASAHLS